MMTLRALLEKSSDADFLREMIGFTAQRLMALDVETLMCIIALPSGLFVPVSSSGS
jgi:uncharacterized membrane protein